MFAFHTGSPQVADASFKKGRQHFIRTHNETLSVIARCIDNPDRSPIRVHA